MATEATARTATYGPGTAVTAEEYERIALDDPDTTWELHRGRLREKPGMSWDRADVITELIFSLRGQLNRDDYRVHAENSRLPRSAKNYYVPDLAVVPLAYGRDLRGRPDRLEIYTEPLPLVVEVWSRSTGNDDIESKLPEYQRRGDLEIWRVHPYERTLTVWRRQEDGTYDETVYTGGIVRPVALPDVTVDLDTLFDA